MFIATTVCAVICALLAAALEDSELAVVLLFSPVLLLCAVIAIFAAVAGLICISYLIVFVAVYSPFWFVQASYSRLVTICEPWFSRLSERSRRILRISILTLVTALVLLNLPRPVQQVVALAAAFALVASLPALILFGMALLFAAIARHRYQFRLRSMFIFVTVAAASLAWLPMANPIDWLLGIAFDEETIYSDGYSAWRWCQIRRGMNKEAVRRLLGSPLNSFNEREDVWRYTRYGPSETYHRREVVFKNGIVVEKRAELYVD